VAAPCKPKTANEVFQVFQMNKLGGGYAARVSCFSSKSEQRVAQSLLVSNNQTTL